MFLDCFCNNILFLFCFFFFFNDTATTEIYTLSLHDALPIYDHDRHPQLALQSLEKREDLRLEDRKSTRLNSSHANTSYAVFCLKKKKPAAEAAAALQRRHLDETGAEQQRIDLVVFFLMIGQPPRSTLFPYAALFR